MTDEATPLNLTLAGAELGTIVLALKLGRMRYGMLSQLAEQRGQAVLSFEALGGLLDVLEDILGPRGGATS